MKRLLKIILVCSFLLIASVNAECDYKEQAALNKEAATIKAVYEETFEDVPLIDGSSLERTYFKVKLLNVSDKFNVEVTNTFDNEKKQYDYTKAKDGVISFDWKNLDTVVTYIFKIYSSSTTNCPMSYLRTVYLNLPRFNQYSVWAECENNNSKVCAKYVMNDDISIEEFSTGSGEINSEENNEDLNIEKESAIKDNKYLIIGVSAGVIVLATVIFIVIKRKKAAL